MTNQQPSLEPPAQLCLNNMEGRLTKASAALTYMLAGNAFITLRSTRTGQRYTYRIALVRHTGPHAASRYVNGWFVSTLVGPDNTSNYVYLGMLKSLDGTFVATRASYSQRHGKPFATFAWLIRQLRVGVVHPELEIWHSGRCGRCGRHLTVPSSVASGFGPECVAQVQDHQLPARLLEF